MDVRLTYEMNYFSEVLMLQDALITSQFILPMFTYSIFERVRVCFLEDGGHFVRLLNWTVQYFSNK